MFFFSLHNRWKIRKVHVQLARRKRETVLLGIDLSSKTKKQEKKLKYIYIGTYIHKDTPTRQIFTFFSKNNN